MRIVAFVIVLIFSFVFKVTAAEYPFVDVPLGSPYYTPVKALFDNGILFDDGTHKFKPDELLTRDMFAGLTLGASCDYCANPSIDLIAQFQTQLFPDVTPDSIYYYCISEASKLNIINGLPLDQNGKASCQNSESYSSSPFCKNNNVTRIEAIKALLVKSNLWDEEKNKQPPKNITITDIPDSLYGYAEKALQLGIISLGADGKIYPDTPISRGEFASMSALIFDFNQCIPPSSQNKVWSTIQFLDNYGKPYFDSTIPSNPAFTIKGMSSDIDNQLFSWKAIESISGKEYSQNGQNFTSDALGPGIWYLKLTVSQKSNNEKIGVSSATITISDGSQVNAGKTLGANVSGNAVNGVLYPSILVEPAPSTVGAGGNVILMTYSNSSGSLRYSWDFGDGTRTLSNSGKINHIYSVPGTYTVNVIATDTSGKSAGGTAVIVVTGELDSDNDTVIDAIDVCPFVQGNSNNGCPKLDTNIYTAGAFLSSNGAKNGAIGFSAIGTSNTNNANVFGNAMAAAVGAGLDTDNDGIADSIDACPTISGNQANSGCPLVGSFLGNIEKNGCVMDQISQRGGIIIEPICESCPCPTTLSLGNSIRRCDVIFPAILSRDLLEIYSRGPLYQIP